MKNKVISPFDLNHFFEVKALNPQEDGSHNMLEGSFKHPYLPPEFLIELQGGWLAKHMDTERKARFEMLSQEIFRLFLPHQPKTVYGTGLNMIPGGVSSATAPQHFVLSKKIENLNPLPKGRQARFFQGAYRCLGHVMALSVFLHEIDLSLENVCMDIHGRVVKLDGDWTLAKIVHPEQFSKEMNTRIDARLLMDVFFFDHYAVFNWFDLIEATKKKKDISEIIPRDMMSSPSFQQEYFEMIIWIALCPDEVFLKLIQACIGIEECNATIDILARRKIDLIESALQNPRFVEFLLSKKAPDNLFPTLLKEHMMEFTLHKDYQLLSAEDRGLLDEKVNETQCRLNTMLMRIQSSPKGVAHSFSGTFNFQSSTSLRTASFSTRNLSNLSGALSNLMTPTAQMSRDVDADDSFVDFGKDDMLIF